MSKTWRLEIEEATNGFSVKHGLGDHDPTQMRKPRVSIAQTTDDLAKLVVDIVNDDVIEKDKESV
jgi:hypothetical protein